MAESNVYDVIIVGAGVIGCSISRELSRYQGRFLVLEKENDVSCGASKANSGIVHGGYDANHSKVKANFSRKGNRMFAQLNKELNFGYLECGSLVLAFDEQERETLEQLKQNGEKNGVEDLVIIERSEILKLEPHINPAVQYALYCKTAGITSPYEMTIGLAENAIQNGVQYRFHQQVDAISQVEVDQQVLFRVKTGSDHFYGRYLVNAAGINSDQLPKMLGMNDFTITPRKGEYIIMNKNQGHLANRVLFQCPSDKGKGILVTRTYHGNLMLGPNAQEVQDRSEVGTNLEALEYIVKTARKTVPDFDIKYTLTSFAGLRASASTNDFIIEESKVKRFFNVAGIDSPGLTSSPAIAQHVVELIAKAGYDLRPNRNFNPYRAALIVEKEADFDGRPDHPDPAKNIICKCEKVTEAEIVEALNRGIYIDHMDGIKRRVRCTMGPCQGNYCAPRVRAIIARELNLEQDQISVRGKGSLSLPPRQNRMFWKKLEL